ncbi:MULTISPECIES: SDR family oxidoreductase [unclassified Mesorhizobium]|uniref:SDR family oxidoreductase n=1 Tax=unclassified Mesorhizobium TaxID=325217 RepID=UPI0009695406|nr:MULTISPECIES: SDR family oxidoreductase [unclassified Mesorhizobium]MBN9255071.1 SDR family oxidoreductase [Mesorhizobium sp.]MBN9268650.1 SDR family oxidoreductase [Mesorhizobium sp.]OJX76030.1 MAG: short-chain dehydrogenase [Mesorhizobium sp. 65-26]
MNDNSNTSNATGNQRKVQKQADALNRKQPKAKTKAMQAGARRYPEPPFPRQRHKKPGNEQAIDPPPLYDAPYWRGSEKLVGKVALITGGDSGIGRAFAVLFAREGADIAIVYLSEDQDADATRQAVEAEGRRCVTIRGDVSRRPFCRKAVEKTVSSFGRLDVLVNNAAFQMHSVDFADLTERHFDLTLKTNLYGYFHLAQEALEHMKPGAAIINTGSITGIDGSRELVDYSLTKGGIHAFTRALSANLIDRGIRVNAVAPGPVWTPLNPSEKDPEDVARFGSKTAMRRPAQPEELAPAYVFLASPECSSYITGEILPIIGGY